MTCSHEVTELRERPTTIGSSQYALQCVACGMKVGNWVKKPSEHVPAWDMAAEDAAKGAHTVSRIGEIQQRQADLSAQWWRVYSRFITSPAWYEMRRRVMARANHTCEACLVEPAEQVHHTVYRKGVAPDGIPTASELAQQPLYELRAICYRCHANQHPHMQRDAA